jgi:peroxiredoxin
MKKIVLILSVILAIALLGILAFIAVNIMTVNREEQDILAVQDTTDSKCSVQEEQSILGVQDTTGEYEYLVKVGDTAPDFEMKLPSGATVVLSSLRGKIVMLQFTASWCGVCRKEMPFIEKEIWLKHKNNPDFALYGIDRGESADTILSFVRQTGVTYPVGLDPDAGIFNLYAEKDAGITRNVIIDRSGKIAMLTRLFDEKEFYRMVNLIDSLLKKQP